jgi:hypothetical protein
MVGEVEARHLDKRAQGAPSRIGFEVLILDSTGSCQDSRIDSLFEEAVSGNSSERL